MWGCSDRTAATTVTIVGTSATVVRILTHASITTGTARRYPFERAHEIEISYPELEFHELIALPKRERPRYPRVLSLGRAYGHLRRPPCAHRPGHAGAFQDAKRAARTKLLAMLRGP